MDKKLFNESTLSRNIQLEVLQEIDKIECTIPAEVFENIFNSEKMREFLNSVELPKDSMAERKSELFSAIKKKEKTAKNNQQKT